MCLRLSFDERGVRGTDRVDDAEHRSGRVTDHRRGYLAGGCGGRGGGNAHVLGLGDHGLRQDQRGWVRRCRRHVLCRGGVGYGHQGTHLWSAETATGSMIFGDITA